MYSHSASSLRRLKERSGLSIGVGIPALNEAPTIGAICAAIRTELVDTGTVEALLVVDPDSTDSTAAEAVANGAQVRPLHPQVARVPGGGKGAALWSTLAYLDNDIVVWIDGDLEDFAPAHVISLSAPLLEDSGVVLAKGFYDREDGGRITELTARPLMALLFPELSGVLQPLAGEAAVRRDVVSRMELFAGYGIEIGLLIDVWERHGMEAISQVDLGTKAHRRRDLSSLSTTAHEIIQIILNRADDTGRLKLGHPLTPALPRFTRTEEGWSRTDVPIAPRTLPPVID